VCDHDAVLFEFGGYRLDDERRSLTGPDGPVRVEPQVLGVLLHLVANRHRAVPKEELLDVVWGDRFVSETALTTRVKSARQAIGDDGRAQHSIATVHGVGYRFVADVNVSLDTEVHLPATRHRQLPALRTNLIGRDDDLLALVDTIRRARLTTLTGPGGVGKTTLALAAAHLLQDNFADGAIFVDLVTSRSADDLARALADAAGVEGEASRSVDRLADHLGARRVLIVLDNCEHVLAAATQVVDLLLSRGANAHVLATSREPLTVRDEHVRPLEPLAGDGPVLFTERARQAEPRVAWDPHDPRVVELCERLDGLPLALELAAGQLRRWSFDDLSRQLEGRLTVLSRSSQLGSTRHGTMTTAIDWSYQLLDRSEQRLLRHLSVFPSWFDLAAVEALAGLLPGVATSLTLGELVDRSLVVRDRDSGRYRLLETIRVYARELLEREGEAEAALEAHRRHVKDLVCSASRLDRWLSARLAADFRADIEHARQAFWMSIETGDVDDAVEIAVGASFLWRNAIGCTEGATWVEALSKQDISPHDRLWVQILSADLGQGIGDHRQMISSATDAPPGDDDPDAAVCIAAHYGSLSHLTDTTIAKARLTEVLEMATDERLANLMKAFLIVADLASSAFDHIEDRLDALFRATTDDGYDRFILNWVGWMYGLLERDSETAKRWVARQQVLLDRSGIVETWLTSFSTAMSEAVDGSDIRKPLSYSLGLADREGYRAAADCTLALAYSEACRGNGPAAAELLATALHGRFNSTAHYVLYRVVVDPVVRSCVDESLSTEANERGRRRTPEEALRDYGLL
jgi:predicted ATPase/DNA-binding winged helix-turn-helix (wHTH) protein